jgi:glycosyltransferase involved in cell wall biosynthesis
MAAFGGRSDPGVRPVSLRVLSIAYPFAKVGLNAAGGAEQILALLDRGLVGRGHHSIVIAAERSQVRGELIALPAAANETERTHARWRDAIAQTIRTRNIDILHFHGLDFHHYLPPDGPPALVTLHLPPSFYPASVFALPRSRTWFNCVSQSQLSACPDSPLLSGWIGNGIPLELYSPAEPDNYVLAMGRICPEKGFHLAVDAAERAGVPLHLAGKLYPYSDHVRYWKEVLRPRLRPPHKFLGVATIADKPRFLASARYLLVPSLVAETSSLVAMEAMASGTPVIAFPSGALAELVRPGQNGFLVNDVSEMASAIQQAGSIDRSGCRRLAQSAFSAETMVDRYIELFQKVITVSKFPVFLGSA